MPSERLLPWCVKTREANGKREEYAEGEISSYEISDNRLTLGDPDESLEWIKSDVQVLVPNTVTLPDGSTYVERRSWDEMKASVAR